MVPLIVISGKGKSEKKKKWRPDQLRGQGARADLQVILQA
jgi:hypothetical protein